MRSEDELRQAADVMDAFNADGKLNAEIRAIRWALNEKLPAIQPVSAEDMRKISGKSSPAAKDSAFGIVW